MTSELSEKPQSLGASAIWSPNATANWSILFSPAFGSLLQAMNWQSLGEANRQKEAMTWFYVSIAMLGVYLWITFATNDSNRGEGMVRALGFLYLVVWYVSVGRSQAKYVKQRFGNTYARRSWVKPILLAVAAVIGYVVIAFVLGILIGLASG